VAPVASSRGCAHCSAAQSDERRASGGVEGQGKSTGTKERRRGHLSSSESTMQAARVCGSDEEIRQPGSAFGWGNGLRSERGSQGLSRHKRGMD
jgi:hypothetical protein